jgi:fructokinase
VSEDRRRFVIVGLGEILWDMLPDGKQLGGAPTNFAYHARALGAQSAVVSCVGDDPLGREILDRLQALAPEHRYVAVDKSHPTGTVTVELDEDGQPDYTIHEDVAWDFIPSDSGLSDLATRADAVCFGSLAQRSPVSRAAIQEFLAATGPDCIRVFDINLRQSYFSGEVVKAMLGSATVLKLNDEELPVLADLLGLTGPQDDTLLKLTQKYQLRMVAVTRGINGSRLYAQGQTCDHPGFAADVADTVGAGDAFAAAITLGLLHDRGLEQISEFANRLASFVCSQSGATPKLPESLSNQFGLS